jgi:hypothetical protein
MTPQEKALELIDKFDEGMEFSVPQRFAKKCVLIAVDEIIKRTRSVDNMPPNCQKIDENTKEYWREVKQEIEKL